VLKASKVYQERMEQTVQLELLAPQVLKEFKAQQAC
jgi:hypothetical protein